MNTHLSGINYLDENAEEYNIGNIRSYWEVQSQCQDVTECEINTGIITQDVLMEDSYSWVTLKKFVMTDQLSSDIIEKMGQGFKFEIWDSDGDKQSQYAVKSDEAKQVTTNVDIATIQNNEPIMINCEKEYLWMFRFINWAIIDGIYTTSSFVSPEYLCTDNSAPQCPLGLCLDEDCYECVDGIDLDAEYGNFRASDDEYCLDVLCGIDYLNPLRTNDEECMREGMNVAGYKCDELSMNQILSYDSKRKSIVWIYGYCLEIDLDSNSLIAAECNGEENQQWDYDTDTGTIKGVNGDCLTVYENEISDKQVGLWECYDGSTQTWQFNVIESTNDNN